MKKLHLLLFLFCVSFTIAQSTAPLKAPNGITTGTTIAPSSIAEFQSTSKGLIIPKMTTTQRNAISSAADGLLVYNITTHKINSYNSSGSVWIEYSIGTPDLQSIVLAGSTFTDTNGVAAISGSEFNVTGINGTGALQQGGLVLINPSFGLAAIGVHNLDNTWDQELPNGNGTYGLSVNGVPFGVNGDATIAVGTVNSVSSANAQRLSIAGTAADPILDVVSAPKLETSQTIGTTTGDVISTGSTFNGTASNSNAATLATVNSNVGTFGGAGKSLTATVDAKGRTIAISEQNIAITESQVIGLVADLANKVDKDGAKVLSDVNFSTAKDIKLGTIVTGATANQSDATTNAAIAAKENALTITAVKTANYSVAANEFVPYNLTGNYTITLPNSPTDGTKIGAKIIALTGSNTLTINAAGSDVFNISGGVTTLSLSVLNQVVVFQYKSGIWYATDTSISKTYIDSQLALKQDKTTWIDHASASTVVGFTSITTKQIRYLVEGKKVTVQYVLSGTSNSTTTSFTLPFAAGASAVLNGSSIFNGLSAGTSMIGVANVPQNSSTVSFFTNTIGTGLSASGTKNVTGQFTYEID